MADENRVLKALIKSFKAKDDSLELEQSGGIIMGSFTGDNGNEISFKLIPESHGAIIEFNDGSFSGIDREKLLNGFEYELEQSFVRNVKVEALNSQSELSYRILY